MKATADAIRQKVTSPDPIMLQELRDAADHQLFNAGERLNEGHGVQLNFTKTPTNERTLRELSYELAANGFFVESIRPETDRVYAAIKVKLENNKG